MSLFGFHNKQNSCFLNTALQLMFSIPPLCAYFYNSKRNTQNFGTSLQNLDQISVLNVM